MEKGKTSQQIDNPYIDMLLGEKADGSWTACPRYIFQLNRRGIISVPELNLYVLARGLSNPYGYCVVNTILLKGYLANKVQVGTINKMLSRLRHLRLVWYQDRQGSGSSFEVHFDDFMLPSGKFTNIQARFDREQGVSLETTVTSTLAEPSAEVEDTNRKFETPINTPPSRTNGIAYERNIASYNTDTNKDKYKNNELSMSYKKDEYKPKVLVEGFIPETYEEGKALGIAKEVGDTCMDSYLSCIKHNNFWALEKAYDTYTEDIKRGVEINKPGAYINSTVQRLVINKGRDSVGETIV